uniref:Putative secreted protein n=1 Tax=Anopheles marajoara TaxID=58244 RepID=A0A2M4CEG0_9DIPT
MKTCFLRITDLMDLMFCAAWIIEPLDCSTERGGCDQRKTEADKNDRFMRAPKERLDAQHNDSQSAADRDRWKR